MGYRCEAATVEGFVQQLAVSYIAHGYWFYVSGVIPEGKDPRAVDAKLIRKYGIDISKWARARRKRAGLANVQYLRFDRFFVLIATHGQHRFFDEERAVIRDVREVPVKFASYAISFRGGHAHVRIERETFRDLRAYLEDCAIRWPRERLERVISSLPFEPYAPVRGQLLSILHGVASKRKKGGLEEPSTTCLRLSRRSRRPFSQGRFVS